MLISDQELHSNLSDSAIAQPANEARHAEPVTAPPCNLGLGFLELHDILDPAIEKRLCFQIVFALIIKKDADRAAVDAR